MTLWIDTTEFGKIKFILEHQSKKTSKTFSIMPRESDKILEYLDAFLKASKIRNPKSLLEERAGEIRKISIYKGKGSFTGLRIAAAIAQALGMAWGVPVKVSVKK